MSKVGGPSLNNFEGDDLQNAAESVLMEEGFSADEIDEIKQLPARNSRKNYGPQAIQKRRLMVNKLAAASFSNSDIAEVLKISKETVNKDREAARAIYTQRILETHDLHRARLLKESMELKELALLSFAESRTKTTVTESANGPVETTVNSAGDPGFLNVAKNCLVEQFKIVGLDKAVPVTKDEKTYNEFLKDLSETLAKASGESKELNEKEKAIEATWIESESIGPDNTLLPPSSIEEQL